MSILPASVAGADPLLDPEAPDVVFTEAIKAKADALDNDPVKIYEFVRNEIHYIPYYGLMKGPEATLLSGEGNEYDQSALLVSMLRHSQFRARFARSIIRIDQAQAEALLGSTNPHVIWDVTENAGGLPPQARAIEVIDGGIFYDKLHIWVEAEVPMAHYRGSEPTGSTAGRVWIPLDPTFAPADWTTDPGILSGVTPDVEFDYLGPSGFYETVEPRSPVELYESQVRSHLAVLPSGPTSIDSIVFTNKIRSDVAGVLPNTLPHILEGTLPVYRHASLVALHKKPANGGIWPQFQSGDEGEKDYRWEWSIHLCKAGLSNCLTTAVGPDKYIELAMDTAALEGKRLTVMFPPDMPFGENDTGFSACGGPGAQTAPDVWLEGTPLGIGAGTVPVCTALELVVAIETPFRTPTACGGSTVACSEHGITAGGTYVPALDVYSPSGTRTQETADALATARDLYPVVDNGDDPFVDDVIKNGTKDPGEFFLGGHIVAQEALVGGLLHLASDRFYEMTHRGVRRSNQLHHRITRPSPSAGLVSAQLEPVYLFDVPVAVQGSNLLLDVKAFVLAFSERDGSTVTMVDHNSELTGHHLSFSEHAVWEELTGFATISMVKGFQILSQAGIDLISVKTPAEAIAHLDAICLALNIICIPGSGFEYPEFFAGTAGGYDGYTNCLLLEFSGEGNCAAAGLSGIAPAGSQELRVLKTSFFQFHGFNGFVWYLRDAFENQSFAGSSGNLSVPTDQDWLGEASLTSNILPWDLDATNFELANVKEVTAGDPVAIATGAYLDTQVDLKIPGRGGHHLELRRSYSSRLKYDGPLGYGWIHSYDQHLRLEPDDPVDPDDNARVIFVDDQGNENIFEDTVSIGTPLPTKRGNRDELVRDASGYTLTKKGGMTLRFAIEVGDRANLEWVEDRNGNRIVLDHGSGDLDTVTSADGRVLTFTHAGGRLSTVTDGTRTWTYVVDGNGDLVEYRDPVQTASAETGILYEYYSGMAQEALDHNLKAWIKPEPRTGPDCGGVPADFARMDFVYYDDDRVFKHTDGMCQTTYFAYNIFQKRTTVTHPDGAVESYLFGTFGETTRHESGEGRVREFVYDDQTGDRLSEFDGLGLETTAEYDGRGNVIKRTDRLEKSETWEYNEFSQVTEHVDRLGTVRSFVYDGNGNLLRESALVDGQIQTLRTYDYDAFGNRIETIAYAGDGGGSGGKTLFEYDSSGVGMVRTTDALGHDSRISLDEFGRPTRIERDRTIANQAFPERVGVEYVYDPLDRIVSVKDPAGTIRSTSYDANGVATQVETDPPGDAPPRIEERNVYDAADRLVSLQNALDDILTFEYDPRDRLIATTSPLGHTSRTIYDDDNNVIEQIDPSGAVSRLEYDVNGRPRIEIDAVGRKRLTLYDAEDRVVTILRGLEEDDDIDLEQVARFVRDDNGNPTQVFDAEDNEALIVYDELGRQRFVTTPIGSPDVGTTEFAYDLQGRLLTKVDALGRSWRLRYDSLGRVVETIDGLGRSSFVGYDEVGNLRESLSAAGDRVMFGHDARGLLLSRTSSDGTVADRYAYDAFGRRTASRNGVTSIQFEYDDLDRLVRMRDAYFGSVGRGYDKDGRLERVIYPKNPSLGLTEASILAYGRDSRGLITSITDPEVGTWRFEHDGIGRTVASVGPNGAERYVSFTDEGFVSSVDLRWPGGSETISYGGYDELGNPATITTSEGTTTVLYDDLSRVADVDYPGTASDESFVYDEVGNRTSHTVGGATLDYMIDDADQAGEVRVGGVPLIVYGHDDAGRRDSVTTAGAPTGAYEYDALGRLRQVDASGSITTLSYDAGGNRYTRSAGGVTTRYFGEWVIERDGEVARLVHGSGIDNLVAEVTASGTVRTSLFDGAAALTHVVIDGALEATGPRRYSAFGQLRSGGSAIDRGFAGRPPEGSTGFLYVRARHYDAATGRFLQTDPIGIDADHMYTYAASNPYVFWDPDGLAVRGIVAGFVEIAVSTLLPPVGLALDLKTASDSNAKGWERTAASLGVVAAGATGSLSPGVTGIIRGGRRVASGFADLATVARRTARGGAAPVRVGQAGENAVRAAFDIGEKIPTAINGRVRIPDGLTGTVLSEVKNVASLSFTRQLRDFADIAEDTGRRFDLFVRPGTNLSQPLLDARAAGRVNILEIPF